MSNSDGPKDGDFASYIERMTQQAKAKASGAPAQRASNADANSPQASTSKERQTIEDVVLNGQEPSDEFLEELNALENAPPLSDEELARQALEHPGADGDPRTPE